MGTLAGDCRGVFPTRNLLPPSWFVQPYFTVDEFHPSILHPGHHPDSKMARISPSMNE